MSLEVLVAPVTSRSQLTGFLRFPHAVYAGNDYWVPPVEKEQMVRFSKNNPFFRHGKAKLFLALIDHEIVGRIAAFVDFLAADSETGYFGFFETINDVSVARKLVGAVTEWLAREGKTLIVGPVAFNTNGEAGLLVEGFQEMPHYMLPYNPPYYQQLLETLGFTKAQDLFCYTSHPGQAVQERLFKVAERAGRVSGLTLRRLNLRNIPQEAKVVQQIYNTSLADTWGFIPLTLEEVQSILLGLRPYADPDLLLVAEISGHPAALCFSVPDLSPLVKKTGGKLNATEFNNFPATSSKVRVAWLAVTPCYRRKGLESLLMLKTMKTILHKNYAGAEMSTIAESNKAMNSILTSVFDCQVTKRYRVYGKEINR